MRYAHSLGSMSSSRMDKKLKEPLDFINIILEILEHILTWPDSEDESQVSMPFVLIKSEKKHQRAYIIKSSQIVSFAFPFNLYSKVDSSSGIKHWYIHYKDINITTSVLSECKGLYTDVARNRSKTYQEISSAQDLANADVKNAIRLFEALMFLEPGYLRYDYDPNGAKGKGHKHPAHHLDVNYVPSNHYKIGLHNGLSLKSLEDHIDNDTDSWYLAHYKESITEIKRRLKLALNPKKSKRNRRKYFR